MKKIKTNSLWTMEMNFLHNCHKHASKTYTPNFFSRISYLFFKDFSRSTKKTLIALKIVKIIKKESLFKISSNTDVYPWVMASMGLEIAI